MNEKIRNAVVWEADKAEFTADVRQRMVQATQRPNKVPRLMLYNKRKLLLLAAILACVLVLAGFTAVSIFSRLFESIPYHDIVVDYKGTIDYTELIDPLSPGDVAAKIIDEKGVLVLYKYFKGDSFDLECYGENKPDGGFMVIPNFDYDVPDILLSIHTTDRTPEFYRQQGLFSFALENPAYSLIEVTENNARLHSLVYEMEDERRITVQTIYGRYQDSSEALEYRPEYTTINGRSYMFLEIEDPQGFSQELYCFLGDDKLAPGIELSGGTRAELLEAAEYLVLYNEEANIPGVISKVPDDIYSNNIDPLLRERAGEILSAVSTALEISNEAIAWTANGREIYADPSEYASYDIQITYTPQAWNEVEAGFHIPTPPLAPFGWSDARPVKSVTVSYRKAQIEVITMRYEDGSGYDELSVYPLNQYLPQTQLDATLIAFIPAAGQIPDELVEVGSNYYLKLRLEYEENWIYTAVLDDNDVWGFRYITVQQ